MAAMRNTMDKYEELLAEIDNLKAWVDVLKHDNQSLRSANERQQAALKSITEIEDEQYGSDWCEIEKAREIASAALAHLP
jgi:prefoldin subunit 5